MAEAAEAGLKIGVYLYSYATTSKASETAAKEVLDLVKGHKLDYPIAFDLEDPIYDKTVAKTTNTDIAAAFLKEIQNGGYYAMLYTYTYFANMHLSMERLQVYDLWLADYGASPSYQGEYGIWQYAGQEGRCPGVAGPCDLNQTQIDSQSIIKENELNQVKIKWREVAMGYKDKIDAIRKLLEE